MWSRISDGSRDAVELFEVLVQSSLVFSRCFLSIGSMMNGCSGTMFEEPHPSEIDAEALDCGATPLDSRISEDVLDSDRAG